MKTREFLSNIAKFSLPTVVSAAIGILVLPLVSRVYPEEEYGYISNFYSVGNMMMGVVLLGLDQAYIRFFNEPPKTTNRSGMFRFSLFTGTAVSLIIVGMLFLFMKEKASQYLFNEKQFTGVLLLAFYVIFLSAYKLLNINCRLLNRAGDYNSMQIGFILGNRFLFVLAALFSKYYLYSVLIMTVSVFLIDIYGFRRQKIELMETALITNAAKYQMLRYAIPAMPAAVMVLLNNSLAKIILGGFGYRREVGILAIATSAANVFSIIPSAFAVYWSAFMYKYYHTEQERIKKVHDVIMLMSIILIMIILVTQDILYSFLGGDYRSSQPYFMIIMLTPVSTLLIETTGYGIAIAKKTVFMLGISASCLAIVYLTCMFCIPVMGVYGAVIGILLSASLNFAARTLISQHYYISISSGLRTAAAVIMIWGLCIGNLIMYSNMRIRIIGILTALVLALILYRDVIRNIVSVLISWSKERTNA